MDKETRISWIKTLHVLTDGHWSAEIDRISSILLSTLPFVPFYKNGAILGWDGLRVVVRRPLDAIPSRPDVNIALVELIETALAVAEQLP
jgi:hypothetical protein